MSLTKQVKPGRLRHHVQVQRQTMVQDSYGQPVGSWVTVGHRYAEVIAVSGAKPWWGQQLSPDVTHGIECRSYVDLHSALLPSMRIMWQKRIFNILSVLNPGEQARGTLMVLLCKEQV